MTDTPLPGVAGQSGGSRSRSSLCSPPSPSARAAQAQPRRPAATAPAPAAAPAAAPAPTPPPARPMPSAAGGQPGALEPRARRHIRRRPPALAVAADPAADEPADGAAVDPADDDQLHPHHHRAVDPAPGDRPAADAAEPGAGRPLAVPDLVRDEAGDRPDRRHRPTRPTATARSRSRRRSPAPARCCTAS